MTRRIAVRRPRRVNVRFWKQGDATGFSGHTTNISTTGMFLATNSPAPSGARIRIEVIERERGFVVEGVVAHARKVRPELAKISESGMGVRFLTVDELVRELLPGAGGVHDDHDPAAFTPYAPEAAPPGAPQAPRFAPRAAPGPVTSPFPAPLSSPFSHGAPGVPPAPASTTGVPPPAPQRPPASAAPAPFEPLRTGAPAPPAAPTAGGIGTFAVRFGTPAEFLEVYRRDIQNGGLFVSTRFPAKLQESVVVQLYPPLVNAEPIAIRARVVQRFEPQAGDHSPNLLAGMGLELIDLPAIVEKMLPVIAQLVGSGGYD